MGARRNHYYYIDRYPLGLDATVFKSGSGSVQTMSWTNDTDYPVLIRGYKIKNGSKGYVRFELYSVPTGRRVVIGNPTIKNVRRATDTVQYTTHPGPGRPQADRIPGRRQGRLANRDGLRGRQDPSPDDLLLALLADHRRHARRQGAQRR